MWRSIAWRRLAGSPSPSWRGFCSSQKEISSTIFVSRLSHYTTDEEFEEAFSRFGRIEEARLVRDGRTRRPKGFGFVTYASEVEAQKALKSMDGRIVGGRLIFVEFANKSKLPEREP